MLGKPFIEECLEALVSDSPIPKFLVSAKHLHDVITNGIGGLHKGHTLSGQKTDINIKGSDYWFTDDLPSNYFFF